MKSNETDKDVARTMKLDRDRVTRASCGSDGAEKPGHGPTPTGRQPRLGLWSSIAFRAQQQRPDNFPQPAAPTGNNPPNLHPRRLPRRSLLAARLLRLRLSLCPNICIQRRNNGRSQPPDVCCSPVRGGTVGKAQSSATHRHPLAPSSTRAYGLNAVADLV